jgi:hypothetical protein
LQYGMRQEALSSAMIWMCVGLPYLLQPVSHEH